MLHKLQKHTLVKSQIIGYALTLCIGASILLTICQIYCDVKPLLQKQTDVFSNKYAVVSKNISIFKTFNKEGIYFEENEMLKLKQEPFVKSVSHFTPATFKIGAYTGANDQVPLFYTDLFFESIPDKYLDVQTDEWKWNPNKDFVPIIIPENYLNLYNFGFAESQGLPVFSKNTISQIQFNLEVSGNGKKDHFRSRIVGFSGKINSILVPENFLNWANKTYGKTTTSNTSRLLVEFKNPSDQRVLAYFNNHNLSINKDELELSKMSFFFHSALLFVFAIALIIIVLSVAFILLSINLIIQKNKEQIINLYNIGYRTKQIARFYQITISLVTIATIIVAIALSFYIRNLYTQKLNSLFNFTPDTPYFYTIGITMLLLLTILYNILVLKNVKKCVR